MRRSRRRFFESILFAAAYRCDECRSRIRLSRLKLLKRKRYVACPRCGSFGLTVLARRDRIDEITKNPFRRLLGLLNARLYHCRGCRFQFHDLRRRAPISERKLQLPSLASEYGRAVES
jgi:DNA-directed RNA polymerase subunit RPC12/RpoP